MTDPGSDEGGPDEGGPDEGGPDDGGPDDGGPDDGGPDDGGPDGYRGGRLGLPAAGHGSLASFGRRLVALFVDWFGSMAVVALFSRGHLTYGSPTFSLAVLGVFGLEVLALTWLSGASFGQQLVKLQVVALDGGRVPFLRVLVRTVLLCLAVPPLIWDRDGRGLHDRAALTAVVNAG